MSIKQCRPQYGGTVLKAGQELSGKIHDANEIFNSLTAQVVSNMHDIKGLLDRIVKLEKRVEEDDTDNFEAFNKIATDIVHIEKKLNKQ